MKMQVSFTHVVSWKYHQTAEWTALTIVSWMDWESKCIWSLSDREAFANWFPRDDPLPDGQLAHYRASTLHMLVCWEHHDHHRQTAFAFDKPLLHCLVLQFQNERYLFSVDALVYISILAATQPPDAGIKQYFKPLKHPWHAESGPPGTGRRATTRLAHVSCGRSSRNS